MRGKTAYPVGPVFITFHWPTLRFSVLAGYSLFGTAFGIRDVFSDVPLFWLATFAYSVASRSRTLESYALDVSSTLYLMSTFMWICFWCLRRSLPGVFDRVIRSGWLVRLRASAAFFGWAITISTFRDIPLSFTFRLLFVVSPLLCLLYPFLAIFVFVMIAFIMSVTMFSLRPRLDKICSRRDGNDGSANRPIRNSVRTYKTVQGKAFGCV